MLLLSRRTWATFNYDELGNQTQQMDALGRTTLFAHDALGRRVQRTLPGGQAERFAYDPASNLLRHTNFNGVVITNAYDMMNRLVRKATLAGMLLLTNGYAASGLPVQRWDEAGLHTWQYDLRDRVRTNSTPVGALYYSYDSAGSLTNLQSSTASGVWAGYQYDALNRLTNVVDNRLGFATKNTTYGFDAVGNLAWLQYPNGVTNQWQYDRRNRLTNEVWKLTTTTLGSFFYKLGQAGNRTNLSETVNGTSRTFGWSYDPLYRLTNETISTHGTLGYRHDAVGNRTNRTSSVSGIGNQTSTYDTNDWLTSDVYDSNGNTRTNGANVFLYDWANRLTNGPTVTNIVYDGDGHRVKKVAGGVTTLYLVDTRNPSGYAQVVEELTVSGGTTNLSKAYTYGQDLISQRVPGSSTNFFAVDGLGSTRLLLNPAGGVVNAFAYDAYGTLIASNSSPQTAYLHAGEQFDADLGCYYLRARYYKTDTGRFWTMDSFEGRSSDPLSLHKYRYAHTDPANNIDPSGNEALIGISLAGTLSQGLKGNYDAGVTTVGNSLKNAIIGVYSGASIGQIIALNFLDNAGGVVFTKVIGSLSQLKKLPGVAKGIGRTIQGDRWLRGSHGNAGFVPAQIAERLAGREFKNFAAFRKAFWEEVAADANLVKGFKPIDIARMKNGGAPSVEPSQAIGGRITYELHHAKPVNAGGDIYDFDNIVVVTPRYHKEVLEPAYHYGY